MDKSIKLRLAEREDCASILEIYAPYITGSVITFEVEVPTVTEFGERMKKIQRDYPWLVCEIDNAVAGYAYASRFNERQAYDWSVDFSVYIKPEYQGRNIGKALYFSLFELLKLQGYHNAYAGIALPNSKSEGLHESFGFKPVGVYKNAGYKQGSWHDVKWYQLEIKAPVKSPVKPRLIGEIEDTAEAADIFEKAGEMIR